MHKNTSILAIFAFHFNFHQRYLRQIGRSELQSPLHKQMHLSSDYLVLR
jgi:hypothetical protein